MQMPTWQSLRVPHWSLWPTAGFWLSNSDQEADVLSGVLKIIQHAVVKRRSYASIQQPVLVCHCLNPSVSSSDTTEASTLSRIKCESYIFLKRVMVILHHSSLLLLYNKKEYLFIPHAFKASNMFNLFFLEPWNLDIAQTCIEQLGF